MNIPTGYAQANFVFSGAAVPSGAEMTLGLDVGTYGGTPTDAAESCLLEWTAASVYGLQTTAIQLDRVEVKFGPTATGPSGEFVGPVVGDAASESVPPNTSMLIQKVTSFGGRAGRGRMYLPGIPEAQVDHSGTISGTWLLSADTAFEAYRQALLLLDLTPVVLHGPTSPIATPTPIDAFVPSATAATQRRRLRR